MERTRNIAQKNAIGGNKINTIKKRLKIKVKKKYLNKKKKYNQKDINNRGLKFNYCCVWPLR